MTKQPYRPSNGTEGDIFTASWCSRCVHDQAHRLSDGYEDGCDILADSYAFDIDDPDYPKQWVYGDDDVPCCSGFELAGDATPSRCNKTIDLFEMTAAHPGEAA